MKEKFYSSGFTLVELLVVVAIIGALAAIGVVSYNGYVSGAKRTAAINTMQQISLMQAEYYSIAGSYYTGGCPPSDTLTELVDGELFGAEAGETVMDAEYYGFCVEDDDGEYVIQSCLWNEDKNACKSGTDILTLDAKGQKNF